MKNASTPVLILGAGPVGLTLANELARRGIPLRIVDKAPAIREVSKALILHVRTQEVLAHVGITDRARAEGRPLCEVVVHAYGKHIGSWNLDGIDSPFPNPLIIGQNRTQHLLMDLLRERGIEVEWNTEATALSVADSGATVTLMGPGGDETVRADYVIGCEGSNSLVRKTLGLTFEGQRYTGEQFIQADCALKWGLPRGRSYLFLTSAGYLMVIELPGHRVRIFISLPDEAGADTQSTDLGASEAAHQQPTLDEIAHHLTRLSGFDCALSDPDWLARYRTSHRYADRFQIGRCFVAGDAGHVHVPIGGQGMNTGIQDAFNLGWKLAGVIGRDLNPEILESYHAERHPVAVDLIRGTDFAYRGILHPSEIRQRATRLVGPMLIGSSRVQTFMRETLEELRIFYPESPLNLDLGGSRGPKPGERVLDAAVVRASDLETSSLAAISNDTAWTLLLFAGPDATAEGRERIADVARSARTRFGSRVNPFLIAASGAVSDGPADVPVLLDPLQAAHDTYGVAAPAIYLLRPDTYIAACGPLERWPEIERHMGAILA